MSAPPCEECRRRVIQCFPDYARRDWVIMAQVMIAHHIRNIRPDHPGTYIQRCYALIDHWEQAHAEDLTLMLLRPNDWVWQ
jgi:hypothetical protein